MSKIRKCRLSWKPSTSNHIVGYRLYYSNENQVNYESSFIKLSNTNEVDLPDALLDCVPSGATIYLGISAVDKMGNESDLVTLSEPYTFPVLQAPADLELTALDDYNITSAKRERETENEFQDRLNQKIQQNDQRSMQNGSRPAPKFVTTEGRIVDNFDYLKS